MIRLLPFLLCSPLFGEVFAGLATASSSLVVETPTAALVYYDGTPGEYELSENAVVSIGVYDASDNLVRELLSADSLTAGTKTLPSWDGNDQYGNTASGTFHAVVLAHQMTYDWDGICALTAANVTGANRPMAFNGIKDAAFNASGTGGIAMGYNEQNRMIARFSQGITGIDYWERLGHDDYKREMVHVAVDSTRIYFANEGSGGSPSTAFITAFDIDAVPHAYGNSGNFDNDDDRYGRGFSGGSTTDIESGNPQNRWDNVISYGSTDPTGMAVQQTGNKLYVSVAASNEIRIYDKASGDTSGTISVTSPGELAIDGNDRLWAISGTSTVYQFDTDDTSMNTITGFTEADDIACDLSNGYVYVSDEGTHQVKQYNSSGVLQGTIGVSMGNEATSNVANNIFCFVGGDAWLAVDASSNLYIQDFGNRRIVIYDSSRTYVDEVIQWPKSYTVQIDQNDPTRMWTQWVEWEIDYTEPFESAFTRVANWYLLEAADSSWYNANYKGITNPVTYTSGENTVTCFMMKTKDVDSHYEFWQFGGSDGAATDRTGVLDGNTIGLDRSDAGDGPEHSYHADGIRYLLRDEVGQRSVYRRSFTGIDASGNATFASAALLAQGPHNASGHELPGKGRPATTCLQSTPSTGDGKVVFFASGGLTTAADATDWHLGFVPEGDTDYAVVTVNEGTWTMTGTGVDGYLITTDLGKLHASASNGGSYQASTARTEGETVVSGCHGEFYNNNYQTNQFLHHHQNGLFLGQFGRPNRAQYNKDWGAQERRAGNSFHFDLVEGTDGELYLYHGTEMPSGPNRYHITNSDTITTANVTLP